MAGIFDAITEEFVSYRDQFSAGYVYGISGCFSGTIEVSKIVIAAGGSGGHIFPASVLYSELNGSGHICKFFTDKRFYNFPESRSIAKNESSIVCLSIKNSHTKWIVPVLFYTLCVGFKFIKSRPDIVVGFGGYSTFPVLVAAKLLGIPFIVHEQNAVLGRVNLLMQRYAAKIITCFSDVKFISEKNKEKVAYLGNPIGSKFKQTPVNQSGEFVILITGGSQGAAVFDLLMPNAIVSMEGKYRSKIIVYQQCSKQNEDHILNTYRLAGIQAKTGTFFENMHELIALSNLVISRAGATSIAEITSVGRPAVYIPYPDSVFDHQRINAEHMVSIGAGFALDQKTLKLKDISGIIKNMIDNPDLYAKMAEKSSKFAKPGAEKEMSKLIKMIIEHHNI